MSDHARPAAGVHLFYLDQSGVLFSEATQELHLLNTTAALIWSLLSEGHDEDGASRALRELTGLAPQQSMQFVTSALAQWRDQQLLGDSHPRKPPANAAPPAAMPDLPPWREIPPVEVRRYRILATTIEVRFTHEAQALMVHPIVAHLEVDDPAPASAVVDVIECDGSLAVYRDRQPYQRCASILALAPIVKSVLWTTAANRHHFFVDIHAGVIGDGTGCILLPAPPGSGKSTLTALLLREGYRFFSDEIALLEDVTYNVFPVPLAIGIKEPGIEALSREFPNLRKQPLHQRADGRRVAYICPPRASLPDSDSGCPVAAIVFPTYAKDSATSLAPLDKAVALKRLLDECVIVRSRLDLARVDALVGWISQTPCHALRYGDGKSAVGEIVRCFAANRA